MPIDPIRAIALILIGSFAIDRLVKGLFFLLSYSEDLRESLDRRQLRIPMRRPWR